MPWFLRGFDRRSERLADERPLRGVDKAFLQSVFAQASDNPMYDSFKVGAEHERMLAPYLDVTLDLTAYDYYVEFDRESS
jgi:hypothetical protein